MFWKSRKCANKSKKIRKNMKVQAFSNKIFDTKFIWPPWLIGKTSAFYQASSFPCSLDFPLYLRPQASDRPDFFNIVIVNTQCIFQWLYQPGDRPIGPGRPSFSGLPPSHSTLVHFPCTLWLVLSLSRSFKPRKQRRLLFSTSFLVINKNDVLLRGP